MDIKDLLDWFEHVDPKLSAKQKLIAKDILKKNSKVCFYLRKEESGAVLRRPGLKIIKNDTIFIIFITMLITILIFCTIKHKREFSIPFCILNSRLIKNY